MLLKYKYTVSECSKRCHGGKLCCLDHACRDPTSSELIVHIQENKCLIVMWSTDGNYTKKPLSVIEETVM